MGFIFVMAIYVYIAFIAYSYLIYRKYYSDVLLESTENTQKQKELENKNE